MDRTTSRSSAKSPGGSVRPPSAKQLGKLSYLFRTDDVLYRALPTAIREAHGTRVNYTLFDAERWMAANLDSPTASSVITHIIHLRQHRALAILRELGMPLNKTL